MYKLIIEQSDKIFFVFSDGQITDNSSQAYQRLETGRTPKPVSIASSTANLSTKGTWFFNKPKGVPLPKPKPRKKPDEETEREWLLLGEPHSPRNTVVLEESQDIVDTSILTVAEPLPDASDILEEHELTDSDSSTDIDAVVDEYREKFKVLMVLCDTINVNIMSHN